MQHSKNMRKIIFGLAFLAVIMFSVQAILTLFLAKTSSLADYRVLNSLIQGKEIAVPIEENVGWFEHQEVIPPSLALLLPDQQVLGVTDEKNKHIEVDLTRQKVYAFEHEQKVFEFDISSGKWAPTPTGEFTIWAKVRSQKMSGGDKRIGTYYYLPNVPYVMFFSNNEVVKIRGFSLIGTYWHDNFGHPMSHGCVNMRTADAKTLYEWIMPQVTNLKSWSTLASNDNPGTKLVIYGETPNE